MNIRRKPVPMPKLTVKEKDLILFFSKPETTPRVNRNRSAQKKTEKLTSCE
jgi:hypothetical protein